VSPSCYIRIVCASYASGLSDRDRVFYSKRKVKKIAYNMQQMEHDLTEQAARLNTQEEFITWEHRCDELIESLEEQSRIKRPRL